MACSTLLSGDIERDCLDKNVGGIEVKVTLINSEDIDRTLTTFDATNELIITSLTLKAGKTGYVIEGIKQIQALKHEFVKKDASDDMWKHTFVGVVPNSSALNKKRLLEIAKASLVAVVETKYKGLLNKDAFQVGGYYAGMKLNTSTWATNENDATMPFEIASEDGYEEPTPVLTVLETDYATTLLAFNNKFATAPVIP